MKYLYLSKFDTECGTAYRYHFKPPSDLLYSETGRFGSRDEWPVGRTLESDESSECVIIGGGLSAITLACYLFHAGISFVVIDPNNTLAEKFRLQVLTTNQRVMRSPYEHYTGCHRVYDYSLLDYAKLFFTELNKREKEQVILATAGHRSIPPVDLYLSHVLQQIKSHDISSCHIVDFANKVIRGKNNFIVELSSGYKLSSKFIVYAQGEEVSRLQTSDDRVIYWDSLLLPNICKSKVLVVGGGQTSANVTESLISRGCTVDIAIPNDSLRFQCVDSAPHYFRPAARQKDYKKELSRFPPSIMIEYEDIFSNYISLGILNILPNSRLAVGPTGKLLLNSSEIPRSLYQFIIPCLGIKPNIKLIPNHSVDKDCSIGRGEYVIGSLARPSIGPTARNIDGHRVAAERIVSSIMQQINKGA